MTSGGTVQGEHANPLRLRQDVDGEVFIPHEDNKSDTLISENHAFTFQRNGRLLSNCFGVDTQRDGSGLLLRHLLFHLFCLFYSCSGLVSGKLCWGITTSINVSEMSFQTDVWN
ncbi:hypothetical protein T10_1867 [Trichinella papuae]|uniref:Uncharacterized protein n=1 Tax=Trichinella papuae TaxID=268474 RepID=A0A0V1ML64_9BILA|nr:hypothetical protein T10_1867 [Trichinella papuae]